MVIARMKSVPMVVGAFLGLGASISPTWSFVVGGSSKSASLLPCNQQQPNAAARVFAATTTTTSLSTTTSVDETTLSLSTTTTTTPSWDDLTAHLEALTPEEEKNKKEPLVTLYRDTNGWCPFCERVWVALEYKGIPYRERLINLRDKPEWFKELVPTTLVPALLFHSPLEAEKPQRRIVWESMDILKELDEAFPDTPPLVWTNNAEYEAAMELQTQVAMDGLRFQFSTRNATISDEERAQRRAAFGDSLDRLEAALSSSKGPYRLGSQLSAVDLVMIPVMERWRHQLPVTASFDILENRPRLREWLEHLESQPFYSRRVAGDEYSWVAVAATLVRYFSSDTTIPQVAQAIAKSQEAAQQLTQSFASLPAPSSDKDLHASWAAASKLVSNHEAVALDCTNPEPRSQEELPRSSNPQVADVLLRHVVSVLLSINNVGNLDFGTAEERADAARAARTIAARLCVPRDLGAPAASLLRGVLARVANQLEGAL